MKLTFTHQEDFASLTTWLSPAPGNPVPEIANVNVMSLISAPYSNTRRKQHNEDDGENTAEKQGGDREASIITTRSAV